MQPCCKITYQKVYEQLLFLLESEEEVTIPGLILTIKKLLVMLKREKH